ncbi:MAG: SHOCT domain-containing protein [Thermoanaerobaculia bacterium]
MHWTDGWWHMAGMWIGWLLVLVVIAVVVWLVVRAASTGNRNLPRPGESPSPEQILKERYARGEIDREEYQRRLADLRE